MGCCCDKDAIPLVEADAMMEEYATDPHRGGDRHHAAQFDVAQYEFDDDNGSDQQGVSCERISDTGPAPEPMPGIAVRTAATQPRVPAPYPNGSSVPPRDTCDNDSLYSAQDGELPTEQPGDSMMDSPRRIVVVSNDVKMKDTRTPGSSRKRRDRVNATDGGNTRSTLLATFDPIAASVTIPQKLSAMKPQVNARAAATPPAAPTMLLVKLGISCEHVPVDLKKAKPIVFTDTWKFLTGRADAPAEINAGNCMFRFMCKVAKDLVPDDMEVIRTFINLTCFDDEKRQNNVDRINVDMADPFFRRCRVIMVKTMHVLPGLALSAVSIERLCSVEYQKSCQPGKPKIWTDVTEPDVFRFTKSIIPLVFSMTVQFKVWPIPQEELHNFAHVDGEIPGIVLIMERTKRDISKIDSIAKCRSILMYYEVPGGVLCVNQTIVLNTTMPSIVASIIDTFGSSGAHESAQTADLTRKYIREKIMSTQTTPRPGCGEN